MNKKVILGMSGGVDSSVSAFILKEMGYEVIGITFKVFECDDISKYTDLEGSCCSVEGIQDASIIAQLLKIRHYTINIADEFKNKVISNFVDEYFNGRTPNPCVQCNYEIKWKKLLQIAKELDAEFVATGHYANIRYDENLKRYLLSKGIDNSKDQSYALWRLNQYELSKTILPLGNYTKSQIRMIAKDNKLPVAQKEESFEICFIPDNDYGNYLMETNKEKLLEIGNGDIIFNGSIIGKHKGYPFYTIGQRRGLGVSLKQPLYVKNIIPEKNIIELGTKDEVQNYILFADNINIIKFENVPIGFKGNAKIRYKDTGSPCVIEEYVNGSLKVIFDEPKTAITPGQSFVMYDDNDVLLGGIIKKYGE